MIYRHETYSFVCLVKRYDSSWIRVFVEGEVLRIDRKIGEKIEEKIFQNVYEECELFVRLCNTILYF